MPDTFGIATRAPISPSQIERANQTGRMFLRHHGSTLETARGENWYVGIVRHHPDDPCVRSSGQGGGEASIWLLGTEASRYRRIPNAGRGTELQDLPRTLAFGSAGLSIREDPVRVLVRTDPLGMLPIYYGSCPGFTVFSTNPLPLLASGWLDDAWDVAGLLDFVTFEHPMGTKTLWREVHLLPPGTELVITPSRTELRPYDAMCSNWHPPGIARPAVSSGDLFDALRKSVAGAVRGADDVAIPLSGGLDSRALLGCALRNDVRPTLFTFGSPASLDVKVARNIARSLELPHSVVTPSARDFLSWLPEGVWRTGGMVNCLHYQILALRHEIAARGRTVLDGIGGDAWTGGHVRWNFVPPRSPDGVRQALYRWRNSALTAKDRDTLLTADFLADSAYDPEESLAPYFSQLDRTTAWFGAHRADIWERQRRFIQFGPQLLGTHVRVEMPFYDHELIDLFKCLPLVQLLGQRSYVEMHGRHLPMLADFEDASGGIPLSRGFARRTVGRIVRTRLPHLARSTKELGPINYSAWFRTPDVRRLLAERLRYAAKSLEGVVCRETMERYIREHEGGQLDHSSSLSCILTLSECIFQVAALSDGSPAPEPHSFTR